MLLDFDKRLHLSNVKFHSNNRIKAPNNDDLFFEELSLVFACFEIANVEFTGVFVVNSSFSLVDDGADPSAPIIVSHLYLFGFGFGCKMLNSLMCKGNKDYREIGLFHVFLDQLFNSCGETESIELINHQVIL